MELLRALQAGPGANANAGASARAGAGGPNTLVPPKCTSRLTASIVEKSWRKGGAKSIGLDGQGSRRLDTRRSEVIGSLGDHKCGDSRKAG